MRVIYKVGFNTTTTVYQDKDIYVMARGAGRIVNYALAPTI